MNLDDVWKNIGKAVNDALSTQKDPQNQFPTETLKNENGLTTKNATSFQDYINAILGLGIEKVRNTEIGQEIEQRAVENVKKEATFSVVNGVLDFIKGPYGVITLVVTFLIFLRGRI